VFAISISWCRSPTTEPFLKHTEAQKSKNQISFLNHPWLTHSQYSVAKSQIITMANMTLIKCAFVYTESSPMEMKATQKVTQSFVRPLVNGMYVRSTTENVCFSVHFSPLSHRFLTKRWRNPPFVIFLYKSPSFSLLFTSFVCAFHTSRRAIMR
jgi:hypothetical protein